MTTARLEALDDILLEDCAEFGETLWFMRHEDKCNDWKERTGYPGHTRRGFFTKHSNLFFRHFGLSIWTTHTQPSQGKPKQLKVTDQYTSTVAYLTVPTESVERTLKRGYREDFEGSDEPFVATEDGTAEVLRMPSPLTKIDTLKFSRALRVLGVTAAAHPDRDQPPSTVTKVESKQSRSQSATAEDAETTDACKPELRLLLRNGVDGGF